MAQLSLFGNGPQRLLDDASGLIELIPELVDRATAQAWFVRLQREVAWKGGRRLMYEREVDVPRLRAHYRLDDPALPSAIQESRAALARVTDAPFDSVVLPSRRTCRTVDISHSSTNPYRDLMRLPSP